jgi:hypothetical protein
VLVERITRIDEVLGLWVKDTFMSIDLEQAGRQGMEDLGSLFEIYGSPCEMHPLKMEEEEVAPEKVASSAGPMQTAMLHNGMTPVPTPAPKKQEAEPEMNGDPDGLGMAGGLMDGDPDLAPPPVMARPVPLVVEVERDGKTWLVKSDGRNIALTLDSLRRLRQVPGGGELRLRATLPAAIEQKKRFFNRG